jgi:hypothetical protein
MARNLISLRIHTNLFTIERTVMKHGVSFFLCIASLLLTATQASAQDIVTTRAGVEYFGRVSDATSDPLLFEFPDGVRIPFEKRVIESIESMKPSFPSLGVTLIMPGGVNLNAGYMSHGWGVRVTAGTVFDGITYGLQLNAVRNITHSPSFSQNVSIGVTHSRLLSTETINDWGFPIRVGSYKKWDAVGGYYDFNWRGFFLEAGVTVGEGSFSSPQLSLQLGYVYQFQWQTWAGVFRPSPDNQ